MNDLIRRKDAIDAFEERLDYLRMLNKNENPTAEGKWYGINWARNTIADMPSAQQEQRWIPCSERLPEKDEKVLITYIIEHVRYTGQDYVNDKKWGMERLRRHVYPDLEVVAWMPLPEPYTESEVEK